MASATKRGDSYILRASLGYDSAGKQVQKFSTWKPEPGMTARQIEKELERQKVLFEEKCRSGRLLDSSTKFADFSGYWLSEYAEKKLRASTVAGYRDMLKRINPAIGHIRLERLQPNHLMELYSNLQEDGIRADTKYIAAADAKKYLKERKLTQTAFAELAGISPRTVAAWVGGKHLTESSARKIAAIAEIPFATLFKAVEGAPKKLSAKTVVHHHRLISSILEKAVKWQIIFANPCERVEIPKVERKEARYLDEKQAAELLVCLEAEPLQYRAIITLLLYSGMRRGELCGLEWTDVDFKECLIDINKSSLYLKEKGVFEDDTKTFSSQRVIKLPSHVISVLREHKRAQDLERLKAGDKWIFTNKLFTQWNGKAIHPDTITGWFSEFIKRNGLPSVSIHSLRHTNATLLIANGTDLRTVSKRLGHANMTTTGNIYAHAIQTADERAAEALGDILSPMQIKQRRA